MLPPLPQFFADVAWRRMTAFSQKNGGEGWGAGAVFRVMPPTKAPSSGLSATSSPEGEKGLNFTQQILITKLLR